MNTQLRKIKYLFHLYSPQENLIYECHPRLWQALEYDGCRS